MNKVAVILPPHSDLQVAFIDSAAMTMFARVRCCMVGMGNAQTAPMRGCNRTQCQSFMYPYEIGGHSTREKSLQSIHVWEQRERGERHATTSVDISPCPRCQNLAHCVISVNWLHHYITASCPAVPRLQRFPDPTTSATTTLGLGGDQGFSFCPNLQYLSKLKLKCLE